MELTARLQVICSTPGQPSRKVLDEIMTTHAVALRVRDLILLLTARVPYTLTGITPSLQSPSLRIKIGMWTILAKLTNPPKDLSCHSQLNSIKTCLDISLS